MQEELLETLRAGPGEAARQEVAVAESGPAPSRWTLRTLRVSVEWLTGYTLSGVWRVLQACGLGLHASCARLFSPDPDYRRKVRRLHRCLRAAARHPDTVVALFLDEFGYQRWPEVAPTWGLEAAVAQRAGNNQQWRTIGALGCPPMPPGSIPLRSSGAGCAKTSSRCIAGWRTGPGLSTGCTISWISLPLALKTCSATWAWWARENLPP